ncbi:PLP-dependent aminotransferase family protein [Cedecea sp. P7760]|jgi:GntR family transcriptional regulator/MocR family aminotransferase|uniref:MocR-like pyridoxine biosynthesis transcription factor PdxR n=1 Tax=Cedecea TaxID=158483 RepID=UPI0015A04843|nr:PLP-dependent aminotransferase family protein [Cedecea sp. P7760]NWC65774.1 PLP-dependent aminotransferase family protein [Cedecea sp. P7760]
MKQKPVPPVVASHHTQPRYQQIARQLKQAINSGELTAGSRLPSSRTLALELGVARATVENAYGDLVAQGWLERRGQAGTFVSPSVKSDGGGENVSAARPQGAPRPFQMGLPALDLFPRAIWARLMGRRLRQQTRFDLMLPEPGGEASLKQAIADYLRFSRSIDCQPEQIFVTSGFQAGLALVLSTLARPGDGIWLEDPGYRFVRPDFAKAGMQVRAIPVDGEGMQVDYGLRHFSDARFALLTPAHQSPSGVALSLPRRHALLEWASREQSWIIEDDYDSEFRYHGKPLPPLKSLDSPQRVIYAGTFSKSMFPALRVAWLVVPPHAVEDFQRQARRQPCTAPVLIQQAIADFLREGHFWRHLKKMRQCYAERRLWLEEALRAQGFAVVPQEGGIQMVMEVEGDDLAVEGKARAAGLAVQALSRWRIEHAGRGGLLLSFTNISSYELAQRYALRLRLAIT